MATPFLVHQLQNIAGENIAREQQNQANQLAFQNFVNQKMFEQQFAQQQEQELVNQMLPALTGYADLLNQSGNTDEAQNVLSGIKALQAGGFKGLEVKQKLEPKEKKTKERKASQALEDKTSELFPGFSFDELEQKEKTEVSQEVEKIKKEARFPELGLRVVDSYDRDPNVRSFRELKDSVNQMAGVLQGGIERGDFAFADQAAIVMFNKVIDPTSVVREGEFARTTTFMNWTNRLKAMVEKINAGGSLTDKERQELVDTSHDMLSAAHKTTSKRTQTFIKRGAKFGLTPDDFDPASEISVPAKPILPIKKTLTPEQARKARKK